MGGSWKLLDTFAELDVSDVRSRALPMLLNSAPVRMDKIWVLPGSYEFTTGRPYVDYGSENIVVVTSRSDLVPINIKPTLTEKGRAAFVKAAKRSLKRCLGKREMSPTHCPFGLREKATQKVKSTVSMFGGIATDNVVVVLSG